MAAAVSPQMTSGLAPPMVERENGYLFYEFNQQFHGFELINVIRETMRGLFAGYCDHRSVGFRSLGLFQSQTLFNRE
nr:hypothetical protein Itr_chr14CG04920 [Ipomoea trifida]